MRHGLARYQLNRFTSFRKATLISLAKATLINQRIKTTRVKAKAASRLIERLITLGKANTLSARRRAFSILGDHRLVSLLFNQIAPRFKSRNGGYCRILLWKNRRGDNAQLVVLELSELNLEEKIKPIKKEVKEPKPKPAAPAEPKEKNIEEKTTELKPPKPEQRAEPKPEEKKKEVKAAPIKEKPREIKKPAKKFFADFGKFFKKQRGSL